MSHLQRRVIPVPTAPARTLYATWRNHDGLIRPVGILTRLPADSDGGESYRFVYLKAAETFEGFDCLPGLPDLYQVYEDERLFPVFRNRLMPRRRPDYDAFVQKLGLSNDSDPFEVLIRGEGRRATDRIEVFAHPARTPEGDLTTLFFARGIRHIEGAAEAVDQLSADDVLRLEDDPGNTVNPRAILLHARTGRRLGWVPDCLLETIHELRDFDADLRVVAEHVNPSATTAPHMRLLCRLRAAWPEGYEPLQGPDYQPIVT